MASRKIGKSFGYNNEEAEEEGYALDERTLVTAHPSAKRWEEEHCSTSFVKASLWENESWEDEE